MRRSRFVIVGADKTACDMRLVSEEVFKPQHARATEREPPAVESRDMPMFAHCLVGERVDWRFKDGDFIAVWVFRRQQERAFLVRTLRIALES